VFEGNAIPSWSPAPEDVKNALSATGIDIDAESITGTADKFVLKNKAGETVMYWDNSTNVWKFTGEVNATSGTFKNGTFTNCTVNGTLNGVSGSFTELYTLDSKGKKTAVISFGTYGEGIGFEDCDFYMQGVRTIDGVSRSQRFYSSEIWGRGSFGTRRRTSLVVTGNNGTAYTNGLDDSETSHNLAFKLTSKTDSSGNTFYVIPCYSPTSGAEGMPIDTIIINGIVGCTYMLDLAISQRVMVVNGNDNLNSIYLIMNGVKKQIEGGCAALIQNIGNHMSPAPSDGTLGAYQIFLTYFDNNY
jgi:hypothetical protein